jgi:hypothetical protein
MEKLVYILLCVAPRAFLLVFIVFGLDRFLPRFLFCHCWVKFRWVFASVVTAVFLLLVCAQDALSARALGSTTAGFRSGSLPLCRRYRFRLRAENRQARARVNPRAHLPALKCRARAQRQTRIPDSILSVKISFS